MRAPHVAQFLIYADDYAKRRGLKFTALFGEAAAELGGFRFQPLTREYCIEFSKTLSRRLSSPTDIISAAVLGAGLAKATGKICG